MMIWKTLHLYGFCSPENCVRCVSQHCGCNANHNQTPLLLLVISSLDVRSEESPWARAFPQRSPTHAVFYRQISLSLFLLPRYQCNSHTDFSDIWLKSILRNVVYPSCLTWFQIGGGAKLSFSVLHMKARLESWARQIGRPITKAFDALKCPCEL